MKKLIILTFLLLSFGIHAQNDQSLIGKLSVEKLNNNEHSQWFTENYERYKPNKEKLEQLKNALSKDNFQFEIFFGTWCPDSQREVPRMVKIFNSIGVEKDKYELIGVNQFKDLPQAYEARSEEINLNRVPTLIFYKNGKEVNRYVEFAQVSLLDDLLLIVQGKNYKHSYFSN